MNIQPRFWHTRFQLVVLIALLLAVAWFEPTSLEYRVVAQLGSGGVRWGWGWAGAVVFLLALAVVDIAANDLPGRVLLAFLYRWRFLIFAAIGVGMVGLSAGVESSRGATVFMLIHIVLAVFAFHVAVVALVNRHQSQ